MLKKFLKDSIILVVGKQSENITELLDSKKHVNEFLIAKKLDVTINQARNLLYKIADQGLVSSIRKKDKRKGWYTYFWKIEALKALEFLRNHFLKNIEQLKAQIKSRESKNFYVCERCNIEFTEENALTHNFTCSECGGVFSMKDNSATLKELKRDFNKQEKNLKLVENELKIEKERLEKIQVRETKKLKLEKKKKVKKIIKKEKVKKKVKKIIKKEKTKKKTKKISKKIKKTKKAKKTQRARKKTKKRK